jgi:O-antigen biosynthesis alpha-1,2-rhamnosyltransferase
MKFLIECTFVYEHPNYNSGIQRVVRNIIAKLSGRQDSGEVIPVILRNHKVFEVKSLEPRGLGMFRANLLYAKLVQLRERYWRLFDRISEYRPFRTSRMMETGLLTAMKLAGLSFVFPILLLSRICQKREIGERIVELEVHAGDVLILLDSSWHSDCFSLVDQLKARGVSIVSVIYDLIPLTHPRYCHRGLVPIFQHWLRWTAKTADGFMAISQTIRDQMKTYVHQNVKETKSGNQWFDYFHLGTELDLAGKSSIIRQDLQNVFLKESNYSVYLMVGTIEPRKNYGFLLDAFELLWKEGSSVALCIAGKVGWKCQDLVERVKSHIEYNKRLFMFNDLNDRELEYCYRHSRSLVYPSYVEGFGLPLVEAMQRGLPVMASDIPVFHEVGGDFVAYFNPDQPETVAELILDFEKKGEFPAAKKLEEWSWLSWEDSARQFLTKITDHITIVGDETNLISNKNEDV